MSTPASITPREQQVVEYLCLGFENKEIAIALHISPRTVEAHRLNILKKYKVRNIVELVRIVYRIAEREIDQQAIALAVEPMGEIDLRPGAINRVTR